MVGESEVMRAVGAQGVQTTGATRGETDSGGEGGGVREAEEKARKSAERCRLKPVGCHVRKTRGGLRGSQKEDGLGTDDRRR